MKLKARTICSLILAVCFFSGIGFYKVNTAHANKLELKHTPIDDNDYSKPTEKDESYFNQGTKGNAYQGARDTYYHNTGKNPDDIKVPEVGPPVIDKQYSK